MVRSGFAGAPVDAASLAFFRIAFGGLAALHVARGLVSGAVRRDWIEPSFHFAYPGLEWLEPWPAPWPFVHAALLVPCALGIALGWRTRICALAFFVGYATALLWDPTTYQNHHYLIALLALLLAVVPAQRAASLDARRRGSDPTVPRWGLYLIRFQVAVPYAFAGLAKLGGDWLAGQPLGLWLAERAHLPGIGPWLERPGVVAALVWGGLLFDLAIVPALLVRRTRAAAFAFACAFHLMNAALFSIDVFPWLMIAATTVFFEPDWPRRILARWRGRPETESVRAREPGPDRPPGPLVRAFVGLWVAFQLAFPLRHWLWTGRVDWTERGQRFAWHMKHRDKVARLHGVLGRDVDAGTFVRVDASELLTARQLTAMCTHPGLLRQFARHVARRAGAQGVRLEVFVRVDVSLNGRPFQPLVEPDVDLAADELGRDGRRWIPELAGEPAARFEHDAEGSDRARPPSLTEG